MKNRGLVLKCLAVIDSCNTLDQLEVARKFSDLAIRDLESPEHWEAMFQLTNELRSEEIRES